MPQLLDKGLSDHVLFLSLDPELKEQLVEVIEKLLKDQTTVRYQCSNCPFSNSPFYFFSLLPLPPLSSTLCFVPLSPSLPPSLPSLPSLTSLPSLPSLSPFPFSLPSFPSYLSCILILYLILSLSFTPSSQLVAGSIVMAFEVVCPDRIDLIHKNYRKLCSLLVDVDEWGQATILNMLTRYARTQFVDPNKEVCILNHTPKILLLS